MSEMNEVLVPTPQRILPHFKQHSNWDCGLTCVQMLLTYLEIPWEESKLKKDLKTKSVWTIDLAVLLRKYASSHQVIFTTILEGVNNQYENYSYYSQQFSNDKDRVEELFQKASTIGVTTQHQSLSKFELCEKLQQGFFAIVLVNVNLLVCQNCGSFFKTMLSSLPLGFTGHFILVYGFRKQTKTNFFGNSEDEILFVYHDPARANAPCEIVAQELDTARMSSGTDEDIIFIHRDCNEKINIPIQNGN